MQLIPDRSRLPVPEFLQSIAQGRLERIRACAYQRQADLAVVLENVHDSHNVGAVLRSADSIGVKDVYIISTEKRLLKKNGIIIGKKTTAGTRKWLDLQLFDDHEACFAEVKKRNRIPLAAYVGPGTKNLYDLDLCAPTALVFGNEADGLSEECLRFCEGRFMIPQHGMAVSLNISVAAAISLYEAQRQRAVNNCYAENKSMGIVEKEALFQSYLMRNDIRFYQHTVRVQSAK